MSKKVQKNFLMGLNIWWSWGLSIFCHFFIKKISFLRGWVVFLSKKRQFFSCKTSVFAGLGALFSNFFVDFLAFFLNVPAPPEGRAREANTRCWQPVQPSRYGERAKRARLTRDADSRCTLAGGPQPLSIFVVMLQCVSRRELQPLLLFAADLLLP